MMVADVPVKLPASFAQRDAPGGNLLHDQHVDEVLPCGRVAPILTPRAPGLRRHGLSKQLVGVVLWRELDHVTAGLPLAPGQDLEQRALPDSAATDQDPPGSRFDPAVRLRFHEILVKAALDVTLSR